jgi:hypothetical protein
MFTIIFFRAEGITYNAYGNCMGSSQVIVIDGNKNRYVIIFNVKLF